MFVFVPIRTDSPVRRAPIINHVLIGLNVLAFLATDIVGPNLLGLNLKQNLALLAGKPQLFQFITYQFLHGDVFHLFGNMLFLWVFGNSVNAKMGQIPYLLFYLASGIFAGAGFASMNDNSLIGASGAIAGVTTAYLVLFPHSEVTVFYWIWFYLGTTHVQALLIIGLKIILWDNLLAPRLTAGSGATQVAYSAHMAGYAFGFMVGMFLLAIKAVPRDQYDILALWKRRYQRAQLRAVMADPNAQARATFGRVARPVSMITGRPVSAVAPEVIDEITRLRSEIAEALERGDYSSAAEKWESLVARYPDQCLPRRQMLDVANQLMTMQRYPQAAAAYDKYLKFYPKANDAEQVALILGIVYAQYLQQYEPAQRLLQRCTERLTNASEREKATQWLDAVTAHLSQRPATG